MHKTTVYVPEAMDHELRETARRDGRPAAELIREAITDYLARHQRPRPASIGVLASLPPGVDATNVKGWVRGEWAARDDQAAGHADV
ncbi:MAG TPA: ribbon-helix-helix protein, CopG family [Verrucomicrobiae bacterium]|nr:ribbon-helix-helix protein, CopG family [Verrucomicrobiae bacterium]